MTFGKLRKNMGSSHIDGCYEMYRFCNKLDTIVIGGFSKLMNYFKKQFNPKSIISFSDNRLFSGDIYKSNGFKLLDNTEPNFYYIIKNKRENRFKYRKDVLIKQGFDKDKSGLEIMLEQGIHRIYDCGSKKWCLNLSY
jgi:hypothetical protein